MSAGEGFPIDAADLRALIEEARAEARIEAKEVLRGKFVDSYLDAVAAELTRKEPSPAAPEPAAPETVAPEPVAPEPVAPQPPPRAEGGDVWYVYCVAEGPVPGELTGVADAAVTAIDAGGLCAVVSRVPQAEFGEEALRRNLNELPWLEAAARAHQDVLDAVSAAAAIVPLRLCTIYSSKDRVREMLASERERFGEALAFLRGKSEWGVKGFADSGLLERASSPAVAQDAGGGAYFERKRQERDAREAARRAVDECVHEVHARLEEWAVDAVVNRPQNRELAGYEGEMVLNAAYLIDDESAAGFAELVHSFEDRYRAAGVRFELTGPWPPYNFVPDRAGSPL